MKDDGMDEAQRAIAELMRTPVGRRWLLKAGMSAAAVWGMPVWATAAAGPDVAEADELGAAARSRPSIALHFALGPAAGLADLRVVANGRKVALIPHTRRTRVALLSLGTLWRKIRRDQLTHSIHTDSGRLGHVLPANTPRAPLATYVAGPGTEIGLLSSPTAVAVTNPGIVIVLEAGASQLAAFDLNGNPVRYFGTGSPAAFTLTLPGPATYLDVAVDGSGQIYVLSYANDGTSQPTTGSTSTPPTARRSPPTAQAPISRTSPSTTGAASTRRTTRHCSTAARGSLASIPPWGWPSPRSAASTLHDRLPSLAPDGGPGRGLRDPVCLPGTPDVLGRLGAVPERHRPCLRVSALLGETHRDIDRRRTLIGKPMIQSRRAAITRQHTLGSWLP
jgi:hypothetical protein